MISRYNAAAKFMLDSFAFSFVVVILTDETLHRLVLLWPILSLAAALSAFLVFAKFPYNVWASAAIAGAAAFGGIAIGYPLWLAAAFMLAAIYRLHARFSGNEDGDEALGKTMLLIVVLFAIALFTSIFNPEHKTERFLYALFIAAISLNVILSMGYRYLKHHREGAALSHLAAAAAFVLATSSLSALLVYNIAEQARLGAGAAAGWLLHLILWPFSGLMEQLGGSLSALSRSEKAQETINKIGPSETVDKSELEAMPAAADLPVEAMLAVLMLILGIVLTLWLKKWRPQKAEPAKEQAVEMERTSMNRAQPAVGEVRQDNAREAAMDLQHIRAVYRDFEHEAKEAGQGRNPSETVRDWTARMGWQVSERFFATYEFVRYGHGDVAERDANPFLDEIRKLAEKNFK